MTVSILIMAMSILFSRSVIAKTCDNPSFEAKNQKNIQNIIESSYADLKGCFMDFSKFPTSTIITSIDGVDPESIPIQCSTPPEKFAEDFTIDQLQTASPLLADKPLIYVYLTNTGFHYAEFPGFYYFVKDKEHLMESSVGTLPKNYIPIQSTDGKHRVVNGDGNIITVTGSDPRLNANDRYVKLTTSHHLSAVFLSTTAKGMSTEQARACFIDRAKTDLGRVATQLLTSVNNFNFDSDTADVVRFKTNDPAKLEALKKKYLKTKDELYTDFVNRLKAATPACTNTLTEEDYQKQATYILSVGNFLDNYRREKRYIDSF